MTRTHEEQPGLLYKTPGIRDQTRNGLTSLSLTNLISYRPSS